jgi:hypothetical protein
LKINKIEVQINDSKIFKNREASLLASFANLGWKWSLYHKKVLELILNEILEGKSSSDTLEINISEKLLVLKFKDQDNAIANTKVKD